MFANCENSFDKCKYEIYLLDLKLFIVLFYLFIVKGDSWW
mgnify:CR=1 FL=1